MEIDLPDIVGDGCDPRAKRATARVFDTPSPNGRQIGIVHLRDEGNAGCWLNIELTGGPTVDMPILESGYEIAAGDLLLLAQAVRERVPCYNWTNGFLTSME